MYLGSKVGGGLRQKENVQGPGNKNDTVHVWI